MSAALTVLERVPSILVFLTALTVVSECCSVTGVFDVVSDAVVRFARGRVALTWLLLVGASCLVTAFLSLDTTAVLMTTAAVTVARRTGRPVAAFAFPTLWIANMASMWLPVSNLTTLLARDVLSSPSALSYVAASWPVALTTTLVPLACAAVMFRRHLRGRVSPQASTDDHEAKPDPTARRLVSLVVVLMSAAILLVEPAVAATVAALASVVAVWWRLPARRREIGLPWSSLLTTSVLFCAVAVLHGAGVLDVVTRALSQASPWKLTVAGGLCANVVNNLPAYLALEPTAHRDTTQLLALLIGVNVASGLTWWGSVATLLWRDRLRRAGEHVGFGEHLARTGSVTVLTTAAALAVLTVHP